MFSAGRAAIQAKPQIIENQKCDRQTQTHTHIHLNRYYMYLVYVLVLLWTNELPDPTLGFPSLISHLSLRLSFFLSFRLYVD